MLKIDNSLLIEIGLGGLPENEKNSFLKHVYETLEMRVGVRLADQMSNQQLDEFEQYFEAKDDAGAFKWLEANFPNYKEIVQEEFDKLKAEVAQTAPQILAASQAQAGQPQPIAQPQPQPYADPTAQPQPFADPNAGVQPQQPQPQYQQPQPQSQQYYQPPAQPYADPNAGVQPQPQYQQPQAQPQPQQYQPQPQYPPQQQPPANPPQ